MIPVFILLTLGLLGLVYWLLLDEAPAPVDEEFDLIGPVQKTRKSGDSRALDFVGPPDLSPDAAAHNGDGGDEGVDGDDTDQPHAEPGNPADLSPTEPPVPTPGAAADAAMARAAEAGPGWTSREPLFACLACSLVTATVVAIVQPDMDVLFASLTVLLLALLAWLIFRYIPAKAWPSAKVRNRVFAASAGTLALGGGLAIGVPDVLAIFTFLTLSLVALVLWIVFRRMVSGRQTALGARQTLIAALIFALVVGLGAWRTLREEAPTPRPVLNAEARAHDAGDAEEGGAASDADDAGASEKVSEPLAAPDSEAMVQVLRDVLSRPEVTDAAWNTPQDMVDAPILLVAVWDNGRERSDLAKRLCRGVQEHEAGPATVRILEQQAAKALEADWRELGRADCPQD